MNMCGLILPCQNYTLFQTKKAISITSLFQTKTLGSRTIPFRAAHSLYIGVPLPPPGGWETDPVK